MDEAITFWNNFASTSGELMNNFIPLLWLILGLVFVLMFLSAVSKHAKSFFKRR